MSLMEPIRGLRPPWAVAADVAEPPYDVMNRAEALAMAAGRPNSFLHVSRPDIDLPADVAADSPQAYQLAAAAFRRLQSDGMLVRDRSPCFYVYRMTAGEHVQTGIVGGASVAAYDTGRIRRHETTRPDKQADRVAQIEAVHAQTGPVFLAHRPDSASSAAVAAVTTESAQTALIGPHQVRHEIWPVTDPELISALVAAFDAMGSLYIADGHHRSAAACVVHQRRATSASAVFLAVSFPADEVQILAYNRLVRTSDGLSTADLLSRAEQRFSVERWDGPVTPAAPGRFGLYVDGCWYLLRAPEQWRAGQSAEQQLDVALLQRHFLAPALDIVDQRTDPRIGFVGGSRPLTQLEAAVDSGQWSAAVSMYPTTMVDLIAVADAGGIMPPKSTWFEPKLLDGLISHVLD